jgi:hypothetical protein
VLEKSYGAGNAQVRQTTESFRHTMREAERVILEAR